MELKFNQVVQDSSKIGEKRKSEGAAEGSGWAVPIGAAEGSGWTLESAVPTGVAGGSVWAEESAVAVGMAEGWMTESVASVGGTGG